MNAGIERLQIQPIQVSDVKFSHETHESIKGYQQDVASLNIFVKDFPGKIIRLQILPNLFVQFTEDEDEDDFLIMN